MNPQEHEKQDEQLKKVEKKQDFAKSSIPQDGEKYPEAPTAQQQKDERPTSFIRNEDGAIGYILAWMLGVPTTLLVVIFLLRG